MQSSIFTLKEFNDWEAITPNIPCHQNIHRRSLHTLHSISRDAASQYFGATGIHSPELEHAQRFQWWQWHHHHQHHQPWPHWQKAAPAPSLEATLLSPSKIGWPGYLSTNSAQIKLCWCIRWQRCHSTTLPLHHPHNSPYLLPNNSLSLPRYCTTLGLQWADSMWDEEDKEEGKGRQGRQGTWTWM